MGECLLDDALGDLLGVLFFLAKLPTEGLFCLVKAFFFAMAFEMSILFLEITDLAAFFCCLREFLSSAIWFLVFCN
jgi:hypothetical protein